MALLVFNRSEKKYMVNEEQYQRITRAIEPFMVMDKYNADGRRYQIANIYYDTPDNGMIMKSIEKPMYKEKLRLRCYGIPQGDDDVFFEIKKKYNGVVNKRRTDIRLDKAYEFVNRHGITDEEITPEMNRQVVREIGYMLRLYDIMPKVFISYERMAFFGREDKDFRLTFDTNILTRRDDLRLEDGIYGTPLLNDGLYIMEMKSNDGVPGWFAHMLSELKLYPISISKYGTEYKKYISGTEKKNEYSSKKTEVNKLEGRETQIIYQKGSMKYV